MTTSLCSPSRSSFLTGCYAHATGVLDNRRDSFIRDDVPRVLPMLKQAGYSTGYGGKVHIPNIEGALGGVGYTATFPGQGRYAVRGGVSAHPRSLQTVRPVRRPQGRP